MTSPVAPPRPARDGAPKWLIILLVVVLFVVLGSVSYWVSKRVEAPEIQQVAQEQIEGQDAAVGNDDTGLSVPTGFPRDIPIAPGFTVFRWDAPPPGANVGALLLTGDTAIEKVEKYYETEMANKGWKYQRTSGGGETMVQVYTKDKRQANVWFTITNGHTSLTLAVKDE